MARLGVSHELYEFREPSSTCAKYLNNIQVMAPGLSPLSLTNPNLREARGQVEGSQDSGYVNHVDHSQPPQVP